MHSEAFLDPMQKLAAPTISTYPRKPLVSIKGVLFATAWAIPVLMLLGMKGA